MITNQEIAAARWVIVPGTLCTPEVFDPVLSLLGIEHSRRVAMMVDSPSLPELGTRLDNLVVPGDIVCGFSLGSLVLAQNLDALSKARAVVLLSVNPLSDTLGNATNRRAVRDRVLAGDAAGWVNDSWQVMSPNPESKARDTVTAMAKETTVMIIPQTEIAIMRPDATSALVATDMRLVFVTGAQDVMTPPGPVVDVAARAKRAAVRILPGLGHFCLIEEPARVADAIAEGLNEVLNKQL